MKGDLVLGFEQLEINKEMVFSTAHITKRDDEILEHLVLKDGNRNVDKFGYGYRLLISKQSFEDGFDYHELSAFVCFLMGIALLGGCKWLVLDRDGPVIDSLPVHEW
ncbi:MAG: hypothetical protein QM504_06665 [Pseudomonadota bacterium]